MRTFKRPNITQKDYCQESGSGPPCSGPSAAVRLQSELSRVKDSHIPIRPSAQSRSHISLRGEEEGDDDRRRIDGKKSNDGERKYNDDTPLHRRE